VYFHAELNDFFGAQTESPPDQINFIKVNGWVIANSDVIEVVRELLRELSPDTRDHHEPLSLWKWKDIELEEIAPANDSLFFSSFIYLLV
jgi:hypothetical protein